MAVEAPLHLERVLLLHQRHLVDAPVAGLAAHPLLHVDAVVEVDEVGQVVDADPAQRLVVAEAGADRLENRRRADQICEWQFMQVLVGGMPANDDVSTDVWQYRQSIPSSRT